MGGWSNPKKIGATVICTRVLTVTCKCVQELKAIGTTPLFKAEENRKMTGAVNPNEEGETRDQRHPAYVAPLLPPDGAKHHKAVERNSIAVTLVEARLHRQFCFAKNQGNLSK
jgi:hypothetical protein